MVVTLSNSLLLLAITCPETETRRIQPTRIRRGTEKREKIMSNFVVNAADLLYILKQIKIAEATSAGLHARRRAGLDPSGDHGRLWHHRRQCGAIAGRPAHRRWHRSTICTSRPTGTPGTPGYDPGTSEYGAADTLFPRLTDPVYNNDGDGDSMVVRARRAGHHEHQLRHCRDRASPTPTRASFPT